MAVFQNFITARVLFCISVLLDSIACFSQQTNAGIPLKSIKEYVRKQWGSQQGINLGVLSDVVQTNDGYIWAASENGLVRFDGLTFTIFDKTNSPVSSEILRLYQGQNGTLWIGLHGGGLCSYQNGRFGVSYSEETGLAGNSVWAITEAHDGALWLGFNGNGLQCLKGGRFTTFTVANGLTSNMIRDIVEDRSGTIWISTFGGGLNYYRHGKWGAFTTKDGLPENTLNALCLDSKDTLWIGTSSKGLVRFKNGVFKTFGKHEGLPVNNLIYRLLFDKTGALWIASKTNGAARYYHGYFEVITTEQGLSDNVISSVFEERSGALWLATYTGGMTRLSRGVFNVIGKVQGFPGQPTCIMETSDGNIWAGSTGNGLFCLTRDNTQHIYTIADGLPNNNIYSLYQDRHGTLWVGTSVGLSRFDGKRFQMPRWWQSDMNVPILAITEDEHRTLWVGSYGAGLYSFDGRYLQHFTKESSKLPSNSIRALLHEKNGNLWIGTNDAGISVLRNGAFTNYNNKNGLPENVAFNIFQDSTDAIWIGTLKSGLVRYSKGKFLSIGDSAGLNTGSVYGVLQDNHATLWVATTKGVVRFLMADIEDYEVMIKTNKQAQIRFQIFNDAEGLGYNGCDGGSQPTAWKARDGQLWFHTPTNLAVLNPSLVPKDTIPPRIIIESAKADSVEMVNDTGNYVLPASTRSLEFHFTVPEFTAPDRIQFQYILEGYDKNWITAKRREAFYGNLPHGRLYRFRVIACNKDGVWNTKGSIIEFKILPFWYETWWFYGLSLAIVLGSVFEGFRWRTRRLRSKAEALERIVENRTKEVQSQAQQIQLKNTELQESLETLRRTQSQLVQSEKMASLGTLVAGVSHELNTPIGVAVTAASTLKRHTEEFLQRYRQGGLKKSELENYLESAQMGTDLTLRNLDRAAELVQSFKRVAVDQTSDEKRLFNLGQYLHEIATSLQPMLKGTHYHIEIHCLSDVEIESYPGAFAQIITNLVQNSVKHGFDEMPREGVMLVTVRRSGKRLELMYSDNGRGIPSELLPRIFDPFFTTKPSQGGTGLGMHIVYNLVTQKLGGEILCESEVGKGTTFIVELSFE